MPLRIIFSNYDAPHNPYYGGGGAMAIHEVARRLAARHSVRVVTGAYPDGRDEVVDGVEYRRVGPAHVGPKVGQLLFQFLLPRRSMRERFDVWVESLTPPFSTACLQLFTRRPVVALTQVLAGRAMTRKYRLPFASVECLGLKSYRHGIALSSYIKSQLLEANPRLEVTVIPNGVNSELIRRPVQKHERHILFLGRVDVRQKGIDLLLEAFRSIASAAQAPLVLAGSGQAKEEAFVARKIKEYGLEDKVRLTGRVESARKDELLKGAFFLVMPSRFEASPLVAFEAFCYQLPVVLFDVPELTDLPHSCCLKVKPFSTAALGETMAALLNDNTRRLSMGQAAKEFVRQFDWDTLASRYEEFLTMVVRKAQGGIRQHAA